MLENNNIEHIFKESFEDFNVKPSENLWMKINRKLMLKDFFSFNPLKFNFYYTALIIAAGTILVISLYNSNREYSDALSAEMNENNKFVQADNSLNTNEITIFSNQEENEIHTENENIIKNETDINPNNNSIRINVNNTLEESDSEGKHTDEKLAKPSANFRTSINEACEPAVIKFFNTSENCDEFFWEFGNGKTSSLKDPTFVFKTAGIYSVKLTVTSGSISNSIIKKIKILPKPDAEIMIDDKSNLFVNEDIVFTNLSSDCRKNHWDFGDGYSSTFINPEHPFSKAGKYTISLICFNEFNCTDTAYLFDLNILDEKYKIKAPNALAINLNGAANGYWSENSDQKNVFYPIFNYDVSEYELIVYSNSGSLVFKSNDLHYGWNGYFNNKPAPVESVYIWVCRGKFIDGKEFTKSGNLTVLYTRN